MGKLFAIGDIHGRLDYLELLLRRIRPVAADQVVFLGDLIDRGPDSMGVVDCVLALQKKCHVQCVMGNHEEMLLAAYRGGRSELADWLKYGGKEALASYGCRKAEELPAAHLDFYARMLDFFEDDQFIFSHSGGDPRVPIASSTPYDLRWTPLNTERPVHVSGKTVVCGHSAHIGFFDRGDLLCIDTACGVRGNGQLTAVELRSGEIFHAVGRGTTKRNRRKRDAQDVR